MKKAPVVISGAVTLNRKVHNPSKQVAFVCVEFQSLIGKFVIIFGMEDPSEIGGFQSLIGRFVMGFKGFVQFGHEFQSLIGRFVILNTPHHHYNANFSTFAEITQCFTEKTHKTLQPLTMYFPLHASTSAKTQFFMPLKRLGSNSSQITFINPYEIAKLSRKIFDLCATVIV